jgi:hypothetical protein
MRPQAHELFTGKSKIRLWRDARAMCQWFLRDSIGACNTALIECRGEVASVLGGEKRRPYERANEPALALVL